MELLHPLVDAEYPAASGSTSGTAVTLGPWKPGPQGVLVWCTQDAYISVGVGVTATSSSTPIPAYTPIPFHAPQTGSGAPWQVSALQVSTSGTVYAKPINIR
jgi:hypothetical protein